MRGKVLGFVGVVAVGAMGVDCGPPPVPFAATFNYGIRTESPMGGPPPLSSNPVLVMAPNGQPGPEGPLALRCGLQRLASGNVVFNISACRSTSGTCESGVGVQFCGEVSPSGLPQMASRGAVNIYINGAQGRGQVPGNCQITVRSLTNNRDMGSQNPNSISGSIRCMGVPDTSMPGGRTLSIIGLTDSMSQDAGDFEVTSCPMSNVTVTCQTM